MILLKINSENEQENLRVGIALPGVIDSKNKKIIEHGAIIDDGLDIVKYLGDHLKCKNIIIENDAKAPAYGEIIFGDHENVNNLVYLSIGTGLGCGIIIDRKIMKSKTHKIGELGKQFSNINKSKNDLVVALETAMGGML
ncbi:ROK family protein [Mesoplasma coleopterae]|uniref:ROK family protein n=1 Tax=Mesoplasma coleopterae TaxID=324078 RepID=A0A2K8P308_9MOLU|nr:ROK family protein [Mesoplasma coleopterae]ATZ20530.1 hypothetical protein MCOLE_v1c00150 [Mesoplasma coleopterae]